MRELCENCFEPKEENQPCPNCGYNGEGLKDNSILKPGTVINSRYSVGKCLGRGGFGITYLAYDTNFKMKVCIKEYFPGSISTRDSGSTSVVPYTNESADYFEYGKLKFIDEARTLARFNSIPSIVSVYDFFEENGTAYIAMEYLDGMDFNQYLNRYEGSKASWSEVIKIMTPVLEALCEVHMQGIIHRDISPDNIFMTNKNQVKLLDFGAARYAIGEKAKSMSVILKHGFAPLEQYSRKGKQGPWTDVYAVCATIYRAVTGKTPIEAIDRVSGEAIYPPSHYGSDIPSYAEEALMKGLAVNAEHRWQSAEALLEHLQNPVSNPEPSQNVNQEVSDNAKTQTDSKTAKSEDQSNMSFSDIIDSIANDDSSYEPNKYDTDGFEIDTHNRIEQTRIKKPKISRKIVSIATIIAAVAIIVVLAIFGANSIGNNNDSSTQKESVDKDDSTPAYTETEEEADIPNSLAGQNLVIYTNTIIDGDMLYKFTTDYTELTGVDVEVKKIEDFSTYEQQVKTALSAGEQFDIFIASNSESFFSDWGDYIAEFEDNDWIDATEFEYTQGGKVYGFP